MIDYICEVATNYTSADFENWAVGIGTILLGLGTIGIAFGVIKSIPERLGARYKDPELVRLYQKAIYREFQEMYASTQGITFSLARDLDQLTKLLMERFPNIGSREAADRIMDDLMTDGYFQTVVGNATVVKTARWDTQTRKPKKPDISNLPSDKSET